jgi:hypothetical protein
LSGNDYGVGKGVSGFQGFGKIGINDSSKEGIGEKGNICVIGRIRGMVRSAREGIRGSKFGSWDVMEF